MVIFFYHFSVDYHEVLGKKERIKTFYQINEHIFAERFYNS